MRTMPWWEQKSSDMLGWKFPPHLLLHSAAVFCRTFEFRDFLKNCTHLAFEDIIENITEKLFQVLSGISDRDGLPETLEDVMQTEEKEHWKGTVEAELNSLGKMGTWKIEDLPVGREAIGCHWVFDKK